MDSTFMKVRTMLGGGTAANSSVIARNTTGSFNISTAGDSGSVETQKIAEQADIEITKLGEKYYLPSKPVEPVIFITLTDNWINFNIRYVTYSKERRDLRDKLSRLILSEIEKAEDIKIASESTDINITNLRKLKLKN